MRVWTECVRWGESDREEERGRQRRKEMVLHTTPYSSACLHFLDGLSWSLVFPCYWLVDRLLASCVATSLEKRQRSQDPCSFLTLCILISAPLYLLLFLASLPFALLGFIIWAPLQAIRQPYLYTYSRLVFTLVTLALLMCLVVRLQYNWLKCVLLLNGNLSYVRWHLRFEWAWSFIRKG